MSRVENDTIGIGALARASGLTVSALRFHDSAGVLVPAEVDGTAAAVLVPVSAVEVVHARMQRKASTISIEGGDLTIDGVPVPVLDHEFPDYRRLLHERADGVPVVADELTAALAGIDGVATLNLRDGVLSVGTGRG